MFFKSGRTDESTIWILFGRMNGNVAFSSTGGIVAGLQLFTIGSERESDPGEHLQGVSRIPHFSDRKFPFGIWIFPSLRKNQSVFAEHGKAMGDRPRGDLQVEFDRRVKLTLLGRKTTTDVGLLSCRGLDEVFELTKIVDDNDGS